jgi:alpha-pyrone synthase
MHSTLTAIGTALPPYKWTQAEICRFMAKAHGMNAEEAHRLEILYRATGIRERYSVLSDYGRADAYEFYPNTPDLEPFPDTAQRMIRYRQEAPPLAQKAAEKCLLSRQISPEEITHLVVVSCTGIYAPGLDIDLVHLLGLRKETPRTSIQFMGCYAAFNGIKAAQAFCHQPGAKVLVICVELCSLHFQKSKNEDSLLANALFGDGAAAVLVEPTVASSRGLTLHHMATSLLANGNQEMAWQIGNHGFEMRLSSYVPDLIREGIGAFTRSLFEKTDFQLRDIAALAVHPGGKRILQGVEEALEIDPKKNRWGHEVLKYYGNMSSPTVLFVLKEIWDSGEFPSDTPLLAFAFGPGLTLESMILTLH